ncbi:MAG TPA: DUF2142 domain-containing protein [Candidatus Sulfotelmatobacter sp.]|nr:DUF2142 domain-containing protein [Candidatus Sulfotelmatobacter sp.]
MSEEPYSPNHGPDALADGATANSPHLEPGRAGLPAGVKPGRADLPVGQGVQQSVPVGFKAGSEKKIALLLCTLAAVHVFVFSAAFPFFNNVDEPSHFDLIVKYSHGHIPPGRETFSPDASAYLTLFSSCAFMGTPANFPNHQMPAPLWTETPDQMRHDFQATRAAWQTQYDYEVSQTPLYYSLCGLWWRAGQCLGLGMGHLLYWMRFLNIVLVAASVWLAYAVARMVFPGCNPFLRLAPSLLLAFMPQTAFYSLTNDILSPVCFGLAFFCLLKWRSLSSFPSSSPALRSLGEGGSSNADTLKRGHQTSNRQFLLAAATGLAFAATWLCKATNLPLLAVAGFALLVQTLRTFRQSGWRAAAPALVAVAVAAPPVIRWAAWCKLHYGDFSGSKLKMEKLGWTLKAFPEWWHHPIFSPLGAWTYLTGQLSTFWQGEFTWHNVPMALPGTATIYTVASVALIVLALPRMFSRNQSPSNPDTTDRGALQLGFICFMASLGFFALMSIIYDFHDCPNPSRDDPYFHAGRMLLGALIPFLLLIVSGLDQALYRFNSRTKFIVLGVLISAMLASEIVTDWPAFSNPYNWFHLPPD